MYITLREAKAHLRIDDFYTDEDEYILERLRDAEQIAEKHLNRPLSELVDERTGRLSGATRSQILLILGSLYDNREGTSDKAVRATEMGIEFLNDLDRRPAIG